MYINKNIDYLKFLKQKKIFIFGCGENGLRCLRNLNKNKIEIVAFVDNAKEKHGKEIEGIKILGFNDLKELNNLKEHIIVISASCEIEIKKQLLENNIYNFISIEQIDFGGGAEYYDELYFTYQEQIGIFGAKIKKSMFEKYISPNDVLLDYGCGSGELLNILEAKDKIGIEINDSARKVMSKKGLKSYKYLEDIPDASIDIAISSSALEHVENPFSEIKTLWKKLRGGGKAIFYVPNESCYTEYQRSDINNHLYTWNCLNLGNLFKAAGYFIYSVERIQEMWPEHYLEISREVSPEFFEYICKMGGKIYEENRCFIVAIKTET